MTIVDASSTGIFNVQAAGAYRIHAIVYKNGAFDPASILNAGLTILS